MLVASLPFDQLTSNSVRNDLFAVVCLGRDRAFEQGTRVICSRLQVLSFGSSYENPETKKLQLY